MKFKETIKFVDNYHSLDNGEVVYDINVEYEVIKREGIFFVNKSSFAIMHKKEDITKFLKNGYLEIYKDIDRQVNNWIGHKGFELAVAKMNTELK